MWFDDDEDFEEDIPDHQAFDPVFDVPEYTVWRTKDGRLVPLVEMTADHLRRAIQVLRGKSPLGTTFRTSADRRVAWVQAMVDELQRRGEPVPAVRSLT